MKGEIDNDPEEELEDDEPVLCPHGYDADQECPVCDDVWVELSEEDEEKCRILLEHASLAGNYREALEKLLEGSGQEREEFLMRDLFQMHISTIHAVQREPRG